ncbi:Hydantoinase B/oxoprolinase-domain-containing protein [Paraphoma chrysanthemicola]|uniref:Hydantoinase B/oxoprolinase-domain-containing protein n=1 Tax=Paraphoma chrysanthemicola TaxID=798071 RepID=A0A8K0QTR9_9PLEO|nr:Hydantoinase B/oxoprolinase-domain-containing protein [Paraphoma chrysanthemicola]
MDGAMVSDVEVSIDRGGTFTDVLIRRKNREDIVFKLLSVDPRNYQDAPTEAVRRALELVEGRAIPRSEKLNASRVKSCRIGTTIATNALLEGKGEKFAFLTTKGFKDVCTIGDQTRPKLFDLNIKKAEALHAFSVEIDERVTVEDYDLNPFPQDKNRALTDPALVRTPSGEIVRVLKPLDLKEVRDTLENLKLRGFISLAISFMHSYIFPDHERQVADLAREMGLKYVVSSALNSPVIKLLRRSNAASTEAYLGPIIQAYVANFQAGFDILPERVDFICSDGSLRNAEKFGGNDALLSGPAGGVVGIAKSCYDGDDQTPIIGFDMGGTSTDVSRYDGRYDYLTESTIAGRNISTPMLNIATVAAGGGSRLFARNGLLVVGPESAGAHPGPACYRKGGPLTVTDANLFLGRLVVDEFPFIFGENADLPLDVDITQRKFQDLAADVTAQTGQNFSPEQLALGFLDVANETMSRPIRNATEARGFSPDKHNLVSFGGAGGQHACDIADKLGIRRVLIHKYSSVLSAYGLSQAVLQAQSFEPYTGSFSVAGLPDIRAKLERVRAKVEQELVSQGATPDTIVYEESLSLRYKGTDTNLAIPKPDDEDYGAAFGATHLREFAFKLDREAVVDSVHVRGVAASSTPSDSAGLIANLEETRRTSQKLLPARTQSVYTQGAWKEAGVFHINKLRQSDSIHGPALLIDDTQTILVEPDFIAYILSKHVVLEKIQATAVSSIVADDKVEPIQLSVFSHRFMSIAEQMGNTLQRTSISTSIKERLDFSCAIFSPDGSLVANAPHIPLHLGSMQYAIQCQHKLWKGKLQPGDSLLTNHPELGGTHLPDLTVVTPVFVDDTIALYVASRGHHTDIGGKGITAMMPTSKELWEEGILVRSMKIVSGGQFVEQDVRDAFLKAGEYPGCSSSRRLNDNISDIKAQISANQRGLLLLQKLVAQFSLQVIHKYMAVRKFLQQTRKDRPEPLTATDYFDDGTKLQVKITISEDGTAVYDFEGTGPQVWGNYNCPISITQSAVIYTIRCLVDMDIPLNEGCLTPITIKVPKGSILNPGPNVAICGSTLASQRVIDVILRAYAKCAAFAGCANSFGWGLGGKDPLTGKIEPGFNYGETVGGGSGAGPGWHGEHAVQVHSTNTKITDAEVVEKRTPVLVTKHEIAHGTGGRGEFFGGNGGVREVEARVPLRFSILSDRRVYAPYGMNGGEPGQVGRNYAFRWNEDHTALERISLGGKAELLLQPGERLQVNSPAGGGWGTYAGSKPTLHTQSHT